MAVRFLILASFLAVASSSTSVLLPLYVYPSNGAWDPVFAAVSTNPSVQFLVVVNPDSGPGASAYPNSDYISGIAKLNAYSNVKTIGYVHTTYGKDSTLVIVKNITKYAKWANYAGRNIAVQGIFFDETNSSSALNSYTQTVSEFAYDTFPRDHTTVIFNMGVVPESTASYVYADYVITCESGYASYQNQTTIDKIPSGLQSKSAVLVHDFNGSVSTLKSLVHTLVQNGVRAVYFSSDCCWNSVTAGAATVGNVAAAVASG